jgi:hypothetical protein
MVAAREASLRESTDGKEPSFDARATQWGPRPLQVPSLIRRRNRSSGQTSLGFLALLPWRARPLSKRESTVKSVAWQGIAEV